MAQEKDHIGNNTFPPKFSIWFTAIGINPIKTINKICIFLHENPGQYFLCIETGNKQNIEIINKYNKNQRWAGVRPPSNPVKSVILPKNIV